MKHIFIILLSILSLTSFGLDLSMFPHQNIDLTVGVTLPPAMKFNDFSNVKPLKPYVATNIQEGCFFDEIVSNGWYNTDFAEDPFDGLIEIWTVGQPSASSAATLILSCLVGLFLIGKKTNFRLGDKSATYFS